MGERKVLNKYYPPDFDPAKLPKLEIPKDRQYVVRLMAPFTMRCLTCGNYVYKGKKFNSRKETAIGEKYLGIQIYRFYIRCPQCLSEISFKTDPKNTDYVVDNGAYRTFQAERIAEMEEERIVQEKEEEEANNPMLALENRTKESRREMDVLDALEEIRDWNARNAQVKFEDLMEQHLQDEKKSAEDIEKGDKDFAAKVFSKHQETMIKRLEDEDTSDSANVNDIIAPASKRPKIAKESPKLSLRTKVSSMIRKLPPKTSDKMESLCKIGEPSKEPDTATKKPLCTYSSSDSNDSDN